MNFYELNSEEGSFSFAIQEENCKDPSRLIRIAETLNDYIIPEMKQLRPIGININGEGNANIATAGTTFTESVVEVVHTLSKFSYKYRDSKTPDMIQLTIGSKCLDTHTLADKLYELGIANNIKDMPNTVILHSYTDSLDIRMVFCEVKYGEEDISKCFNQVQIPEVNYYPIFITYRAGMTYSLINNNTLHVDLNVYNQDPREVFNLGLKNLLGVLTKMSSM